MNTDMSDNNNSEQLWSELRGEYMPDLAIRRFRDIAGLEPQEAFIWWEHSVFPSEAKAAIANNIGPEEANRLAVDAFRTKTTSVSEPSEDDAGPETPDITAEPDPEHEARKARRRERAAERKRERELEAEQERLAELARIEQFEQQMSDAVATAHVGDADDVSVIAVARWESEDSEPAIAGYVQLSDGSWQSLTDETMPSRPLTDIVHIAYGQALHVYTHGAASTRAVVAAALPRTPDVLEHEEEFVTGHAVLDTYICRRQVAIDHCRWAPFEVSIDGNEEIRWFKCDEDSVEEEVAIPAGKTIGVATTIEWESRTSGSLNWYLTEIDETMICFAAWLDEAGWSIMIEPRRNQTASELAEGFGSWIGISDVAAAVSHAFDNEGVFDGRASELWDGWSETCEISVWLELQDK